MAGLYYEQFELGQSFRHDIRRTVTETDNVLFSAMTHNPAAIHIDAEYARSTEFGRPLLNSAFTLGLVVGISVGTRRSGRRSAILAGMKSGSPSLCLPVTRFTWRRGCARSAKASLGPPTAS